MERLLPRGLLFLLFLGCAAGESRSDTCRLGPYGTPLLDDPMQCSDASGDGGESSLHRAKTSLTDPRQAGAGDPPAKETGGPWAALLSGVSAGKISQARTKGSEATVKNIGLVLMIIGAMCLCVWVPFIIFHFRDRTEMIMLDDEPPEMVFELRAPVPVDPPEPPAASGNPDPACLVPEESQRSSELPLAVADSTGGSGSPMDLETISPAVLLEGNLEAPSEEEETDL